MSEEQEAIADVRDAFTKGRTYLYTQTGDIVCNIAELLAAIDDLTTQLAAAREALSNANERALAYDDELRTLRHRAEAAEWERDVLQKLAVLQDAWETEAMGDITMLLKERNEYRDRAERMERVVEAARSIKEAVNIQHLDGEPSRVGHADSSLFVALDREIRTLDDASACTHTWVDARNSVVLSGEVCLTCGAVRAGNDASAGES